MTKTINTANQSIELTFNEAANCWQSTTLLHHTHIEIEIDFAIHKEKEVDWIHFGEFIQFIGVAGRLEQLAQNGIPVIAEIGKAFFGVDSTAAKTWKMVFRNALYYNGKPDDNNSDGFSLSLLYDYVSNQNGQIDGDAYGLYRVDFENLKIVGASRTQC
ncbi:MULTISPECIES: hypothetical protein [unclassified Paraflavitalea]|uniref:hypothetical protein n=1 Tax=unclassified Paraflavitalea TaxID=2798305 RepID=UPI003D33C921